MPLALIFIGCLPVGCGMSAHCQFRAGRTICADRTTRHRTRQCAGSFLRRRARADLVVRAVATRLISGRRIELPVPNAAGRGFDRLARLGEIRLGRTMATDQARFEEAELDRHRKSSGHLLPGERVDLELETFLRPLVGLLLLGHVARLVVDDDRALRRLVDAIEASTHSRGPELEAEFLLDRRRPCPGRLFLVVEARQRLHSRLAALLLVLAGEKTLVAPGILEGPKEVLE